MKLSKYVGDNQHCSSFLEVGHVYEYFMENLNIRRQSSGCLIALEFVFRPSSDQPLTLCLYWDSRNC